MIRVRLPNGRSLPVDEAVLWRLSDALIEVDSAVPHAVSTAADLRLALKTAAPEAEIALDERQVRALASLTAQPASSSARTR